MAPDVFRYRDYKAYLIDVVQGAGKRGERSRLAKAAGCQLAYISQVLGGKADFSLEQAADISFFMGHTEEERQFFLALIGLARAGTRRLKQHFEEQLSGKLEIRRELSERLDLRVRLSREDEATYYSSWYYAAIHVALAIPGLRDPEKIASYFDLPKNVVASVLDYLTTRGLAQRTAKGFQIARAGIHLPAQSPLIAQYHTTWRLRAVHSLDAMAPSDVHYSSIASFARKDKEKVQDILVEAIRSIRKLIKDSPDEELFCYSMDLFSLRH